MAASRKATVLGRVLVHRTRPLNRFASPLPPSQLMRDAAYRRSDAKARMDQPQIIVLLTILKR